MIGLRWYLARAKDGYLRECASYSAINATLTETVEGARTVEALGLGAGADRRDRRRHQRVLRRRALHALPAHRVLPEHGAVLPDPDGGDPAARWLPLHAGQRLARRRHRGDALRADADRPGRPDRLDPRRAPARRRVAGPAARRRRGARRPRGHRPPSRSARSSTPRDVRFSYVDGRDVLHGVDLDVGVGRADRDGRPVRRRQVDAGPAARGHPPAAHRRGRPSAASAWSSCRSPTCAATSRWSPRSTTSSSARCARTSPSPRRRAPTDDDIREALDAVDALDWVDDLPDGLDTVVGSGGRALTAAQAQQIALARLVLADPHTLVLDEATSLIDPRAARHLERSLAAVLARAAP